MFLSIIFITSGKNSGERLRESGQPIERLRKTCKKAVPGTIPLSFGRVDTSIATESVLNSHIAHDEAVIVRIAYAENIASLAETALSRNEVATVDEWYRYQIVACLVTSSSPVPQKTRRVGQRCTLNLSRAKTSSRWCGVVVRRGGASSGVIHVT
ncbi:uncharacterized protein TNCV_2453741 [Trichonephila clavipes]|nr:uncharacterized protein TNCV_2453741 [Trichonephila clavipes]